MRAFDIWDLRGAFDQFLRQAARLIAKDPFSSDAEELNKLSDPESIAGKLAFAPPQQGDQLAQRIATCSPLAPEYAYYIGRNTTK